MKIVDRFVSALIVAMVVLTVLVAAGPTVVELVNALIWLVLVVGLVGGVLRLVVYFTGPWR